MEDEAKTKFEEKFGYKIKKCGLLIDTQIPYLAASSGLTRFDFLLFSRVYNKIIH